MTLKHLSDMGVRTADDMQFIKEDDLRHLLPPVDCRKLLCAFMKRDAQHKTQQSECTITTSDPEIVLTLTPVPYPDTSPNSEPSLEYTTPVSVQNSTWVSAFSVPWEKTHESLRRCLVQRKRPEAADRRHMFKENEDALFLLVDETSTQADVEAQIALPSTPRLVMLGESILGAKKWMLSIEGKVVLQLSDHSDFASALAVFFGSYYVFNIEYPAEAATSLEFIQSATRSLLWSGLHSGLYVRADENTVTERRAAGSFLILPLGHPKESVSFADWKYERRTFAVYSSGQVHITDKLQFSGRLKVGSDHLSVEVTDLQLQDSGSYSIVVEVPGGQLPTKIISLTVYGVSNSGASFSVFSLLSSLMAASPYLLVSIVLGVKCYRAGAKSDEEKRADGVIEDGARLYVRADENTVTERRAARSFLILPLGHPKESVTYAEWRYEGKIFAVYTQGQVHIEEPVFQFSGRLKVGSDHLSVEVTDLQLQDSGSYSIVADKSGVQLPTKIISLTVYAVLKIEIESNQSWVESKNSCEVHLLCKVREDQKVSYTWRGYKTESGAELRFTLSPAEGDVTLTCTAANSYSNDTKTMKVTCNPSKTPTGVSNSGASFSVFSLLSSLMAASPYLLVSIVLGVKCYRAGAKSDEEKRADGVIEDGAR
ncbi:hypothetical protein MHYP_G00013350 [Metynnis hypsauchen]